MTILATLLTEAQAKRGASDREVARQVNISPTTVGRIKRGESVDLATLEKVCAWVGVDPSAVLDAYADNDASLGDQIQAILEVNPTLYEAFKKVVERIRSGEIPPDTLREIVNFINYRLNMEPGANRD